ncbi:MAG: filamentous hemagglutinin N-terminal domain-containing protein, partial [Fischerella sp.]|nr:filamentous hemagglutinin N-terminal domain-containing protein [Fischerella sp.]
MKQVAQQILFVSSTVICCIFASCPAPAQISADGTIPTNVNQIDKVFEITGGTQAGSNLFHSFKEFSVPNGSEAFFKNSTNVNNIVNIINHDFIFNYTLYKSFSVAVTSRALSQF